MAGRRTNDEGSNYHGTPTRRERENEGRARFRRKRLVEERERLGAEGLPPIDSSVAVDRLLVRPHKVSVATRREATAVNYRYVIDRHVVRFILPQGKTFMARFYGAVARSNSSPPFMTGTGEQIT
jgi:hypothetical protein